MEKYGRMQCGREDLLAGRTKQDWQPEMRLGWVLQLAAVFTRRVARAMVVLGCCAPRTRPAT